MQRRQATESPHSAREEYINSSLQEHSRVEVAVKVGKVMKKHGLLENTEPVGVNLETVDRLQ